MSDDGVLDPSEQLDGDELGEEIGDHHLPGIGDYPPDQPLGVEDPSLYWPDDVAVRAMREMRDGPERRVEHGVDLLRPDDEDSTFDDEPEELAEIGEADPGDPVAPEVDAVHVVETERGE